MLFKIYCEMHILLRYQSIVKCNTLRRKCLLREGGEGGGGGDIEELVELINCITFILKI